MAAVVNVRLTRVAADRKSADGLVLRGERRGETVLIRFPSGIPRGFWKRNIVRVYGAWDPDGMFRASGEPNPVMDFTVEDLDTLAAHDLALPKDALDRILEAVGARTLFEAMGRQGVDPEGFLDAASAAVGPDAASAVVRFFEDVGASLHLWQLSDMLGKAGLDMPAVLRIYDMLRRRAARRRTTVPAMVLRDPWVIVHAEGITMADADRLAASLGIPLDPDLDDRIDGIIFRRLWREARKGHAWTPYGRLMAEVGHQTGLEGKRLADKVRERIDFLADTKDSLKGRVSKLGIRVDGRKETGVYLFKSGMVEVSVADSLLDLVDGKPADPVDPDLLVSLVREEMPGMTPEQEAAVRGVAMNRLTVVHGAAGTGKTGLITAVTAAFRQLFGPDAVRITAPTAIAAMRTGMRAGVGIQHLGTVHRTVLYLPEDADLATDSWSARMDRIREQIRDTHLLVVDEMGMCPDHVAARLLHAAAESPTCRVLLAGDPGQCPPILPGGAFDALLSHPHFAGIRYGLTRNFRSDDALIVNALRIREGLRERTGPVPGKWEMLDLRNPREILDRILDIIAGDPGMVVLSPRRQGDLGVDALNGALRPILAPDAAASGLRFGPGDRVVAARNDYGSAEGGTDVLNGMVGTVVDADAGRIVVRYSYPDGGTAVRVYHPDEADRLILYGYALTPWKAQGMEVDSVAVVWTPDTDWSGFDRRVLYTAVTRARHRVVLAGPMDRMGEIVGRDAPRRTGIMERLGRRIAERQPIPIGPVVE